MNRYKLDLLLKEFPFVKEILESEKGINDKPPINPESIKIKRVDENILKKVPWEKNWDYNAEGEKYFVVGDGTHLLDCGDEDDDTVLSIGEQLFEKKLRADYIVRFNFIWQSGSITNARVIVYKDGKFDFISYHFAEIDKAARELKNEILNDN